MQRLHRYSSMVKCPSFLDTFLDLAKHLISSCPIQVNPCLKAYVVVSSNLCLDLRPHLKRLLRLPQLQITIALFSQNGTCSPKNKICSISIATIQATCHCPYTRNGTLEAQFIPNACIHASKIAVDKNNNMFACPKRSIPCLFQSR